MQDSSHAYISNVFPRKNHVFFSLTKETMVVKTLELTLYLQTFFILRFQQGKIIFLKGKTFHSNKALEQPLEVTKPIQKLHIMVLSCITAPTTQNIQPIVSMNYITMYPPKIKLQKDQLKSDTIYSTIAQCCKQLYFFCG